MASTRKAIGDLLVDNGLITPEELEQAQAEREKTGEPIGLVLSKLGLATESNLKNALELQYGVNYINLAKREPEDDLIALLPEHLIREQLAVPVSQQGERLTIAMVDPSDPAALDEVKSKLGDRQLKTVVCLEEEFFKFVDKAFAVQERLKNGASEQHLLVESIHEQEAQHKEPETTAHSPEASLDKPESQEEGVGTIPMVLGEGKESGAADYSEMKEFDTQEMKARPTPETQTTQTESASTRSVELPSRESADSREEELQHSAKLESNLDVFNEVELAKRAQEEAIVLLANQILGSAIRRHCSNIHIQMGIRESVVHYRLNGRLIVDRKLPNTVVTALVARYKMMARLNLAERKEPQDGHIKVKSSAKEIVCLISVVPTDHGENVVIWIV
jgi:type II secretory ATPase GspE/PulE/Tfp pilus assembly ATPase PilB-like protein